MADEYVRGIVVIQYVADRSLKLASAQDILDEITTGDAVGTEVHAEQPIAYTEACQFADANGAEGFFEQEVDLDAAAVVEERQEDRADG